MTATLLFQGDARSAPAPFLTLLMALVVAGMSNTPAMAQTDKFIAGTGAWSVMQNWSLGQLPGESNDCLLPANSVVTGDAGGACANFELDTGGSLTVTPGYLYVFSSNFVNHGSISVGPGNGIRFFQPSVTATMSGGGTINLLASGQFTGFEDTIINVDNSIHGQGYIGVYQFTNQSLIDANTAAGQLELSAGVGVTNTGTVQASNGATLQLQGTSVGVPFNNSGGIIQALAGSTVLVDGFAFSGGTLVSTGSGMFMTVAGGGNPALSNLTNKANYLIVNGGSTTIGGTINNQGTIQAKGAMYINGNVTLKGGSVPITYPGGTIHSLSGSATLLNQSNIAGSGAIGDATLTLTNQGTINATDPANPLVLAGLPSSNTATLEASGGGTLEIQNTVNNTGGTISALNGSSVLLDFDGTVNGGTLTTSGNGSFQTTSGTLDGSTNAVTNAGLYSVASGTTLSLKGTINNSGTFALASGGCLAMSSPTTLTGAGTVRMSGNSCLFGWAVTNNLTNQSTIEGSGSIGDSNPMGFTNSGTVIANQASPLTIVSAGSGFSNPGSLIVNAGSEVDVNGQLNNLSKGTLTGGTYSVSGVLQLENAQYTTITTNSANITLTGAAAQILNGVAGPSALASFATNGPKGVFSVQGGQVLSTSANFTNKGTLTVGSGSGFGAGGTYTQTGGMTTVDGVISAPSGFSLKKGKLFGAGTIGGAVTAAAAVNTGDSATASAVLSVSAYSQTSTGSLTIPIARNVVGAGYGQLASANGVSLAGKLLLKRIKGYVPPIGGTFTILTGSAVTGQFASPKLTIDSKEHFEINYNSTSVTLTVVAGP